MQDFHEWLEQRQLMEGAGETLHDIVDDLAEKLGALPLFPQYDSEVDRFRTSLREIGKPSYYNANETLYSVYSSFRRTVNEFKKVLDAMYRETEFRYKSTLAEIEADIGHYKKNLMAIISKNSAVVEELPKLLEQAEIDIRGIKYFHVREEDVTPRSDDYKINLRQLQLQKIYLKIEKDVRENLASLVRLANGLKELFAGLERRVQGASVTGVSKPTDLISRGASFLGSLPQRLFGIGSDLKYRSPRKDD